MESPVRLRVNRPKPTGNPRTSVRRKTSFQKVRQQFENISKFESNRCAIKDQDNQHSPLLSIQTKSDSINHSLDVIKESDHKSTVISRDSCGNDLEVVTNKYKIITKISSNDTMVFSNPLSSPKLTRPLSVRNLSSIKSKISYFEDKNSTKRVVSNNSGSSDDNKLVNTSANISVTFYGNEDKTQLNECNCDKHITNTFSAQTNDDIINDSLLTEEEFYDNKELSRSSSQSSDFVTFVTEPEVVFRKPQLIVSQTSKTPIPAPRKRTSGITRKGLVDNRNVKLLDQFCDNKDANEAKKSDTSESLKVITRKSLADNRNVKQLDQLYDNKEANDTKKSDTPESLKVDTKRSSAISQDSGISDVFNNNSSFLYHTSTGQMTCSPKYQLKSNETKKMSMKNEEECEEYDEHIYEELSNFKSTVPNEWIDIETDDNENSDNEVMVTKRQQHIRHSNIIYRKSMKQKSIKRKSHRKVSIHKLVASDGSDASATEYEDIDDEDIEDNSSHMKVKPIVINTNTKYEKNSLSPKSDLRLVEERISLHIYEAMADNEDKSKPIDIKAKLVRELSSRILDKNNTNKVIEMYCDNRFESEPNIYSSTPQRVPNFESNLNAINDTINSDLLRTKSLDVRRDSTDSRNSSIYIAPNYCQTNYNTNNKLKTTKSVNTFDPNLIPFSQMRTQMNQKDNSKVADIASYMEFNTNAFAATNASHFTAEPLYQFYQKDVRRRAELWIHLDQTKTDIDYDIYESNSIYDTNSSLTALNSSQLSANRIKSIMCKTNISAMDFVGSGPNRSLWCQLPQVINSKDNLLKTLSDKEKRLQESMFEIITSEASYYKSINILVTHFSNCIEFNDNNQQMLTNREKKCLFSNISDISNASLSFLSALEKRFEQNILLYDVCDILCDYAVNHLQPYIRYCAYQRDQEKLLTQLTQSRPQFVDVLQRLESNQICQNQTLLSFLMLPMQRITRYPLLIDAVCQQLSESSPILESTQKTLGIVNQLVRKCNEETKKVQRMQELIEIEKVLHFKTKIKSYPIVSGARYLVKSGSVSNLCSQLSGKKTIGKSTLKWNKSSIYLFLFSDLLILAKKKSDTNYVVFDYCSRNTVQLISLSASGEGIGPVGPVSVAIPTNYQNLAQLVLLHNHESKTAEYTIHFNLESEKLRWIEAVSQPSSDNPNEVIYEEWDCPQVQCIRSYCAQQTDEISLEETDVLNVCRKMKDGWYEGQRIRDGLKGWFPSDCTEEIVNQHVRARNMRLRHRLLMFTQSFIEVQKRSSIVL